MKPLVLVLWDDARDHDDTWVAEEDAARFGDSPCSIQSAGFLISKTERYVTIGADWNESDKDYGRVTKIPTGMVTRIVELKSSESA